MNIINKIILGISSSSNIDYLLANGFRQFYFGFVEQDYIDNYNVQISTNRRYRLHEQFSDIEEAKKTIQKIKLKNAKVYLALNSFFANQTIFEASKKIFFEFKDLVDGVIVANIPMLLFLKSQEYKNIVLSNLFGLYSCDSVDFFKTFKPKKMILPRDISIKELTKIVSSNPDIEFECFLYGDNCRYSEAFCFSEHGYDSVGFGSLCSFGKHQNKILQSPSVNFKQILKNPKLSLDDKQKLLNKKYLDIDVLLDDIEVALYNNDTSQIYKIIEFLNLLDIQNFLKTESLYVRALRVIKSINIDISKKLLDKLKHNKPQTIDSYKVFHKLNTEAIQKTIEIFIKYQNITSYKIPSRGRNLYEFLQNLPQEKYNYKESQYLL